MAPRAANDIGEIGRYLRQTAGAEVARRFVAELVAKMEWIAASATMGVARDSLAPGLRASSHKGRTIYFRVNEDECRVVRVIHASRDLAGQQFDEA